MKPRVQPKKPVAIFLQPWRERLGLTQQQVADRMGQGVDKGTVSRWERDRRVPSLNVLAAYAEALEIPVTKLYHPPPDEDEISLDELVEGAPDEVRRQAADLVKVLTKRR